jgi:hypothetical protein
MKKAGILYPLTPVLLTCTFLNLGGCSTKDREGNVHGLRITVTPNPVTGTAWGSGRQWTVDVRLENNSDEVVMVQGHYWEIASSDTGFTQAPTFVTGGPTDPIPPGGGIDILGVYFQTRRFATGRGTLSFLATTTSGTEVLSQTFAIILQ